MKAGEGEKIKQIQTCNLFFVFPKKEESFTLECWLGEERLGDDSSNGGGNGRQQHQWWRQWAAAIGSGNSGSDGGCLDGIGSSDGSSNDSRDGGRMTAATGQRLRQ